jgi:CheY-like chemotaxis protein
MLAQLLIPLGFEIAEAHNGEEAIAQWQQWQPDAILMDMRMPVMDGYEATRYIKSQTDGQSIPILAITSSVFEDDRESIIETGCDGFIPKPVEEAKLLDELALHLHIDYVYGETDEPIVIDVALTPEDLTDLSSDWMQQMHRAASGCSDRLVLQLIEELPKSKQHIADGLAKLAYNFRFEDIVALTEHP